MELLDVVRDWAGMSRSELISTMGAALGFMGGTFLAFAASRVLAAHKLTITGLQTETAALINALMDHTAPLKG